MNGRRSDRKASLGFRRWNTKPSSRKTDPLVPQTAAMCPADRAHRGAQCSFALFKHF